MGQNQPTRTNFSKIKQIWKFLKCFLNAWKYNFESLIWMYDLHKFSDYVVLCWHTCCLRSINSVIEQMTKKLQRY